MSVLARHLSSRRKLPAVVCLFPNHQSNPAPLRWGNDSLYALVFHRYGRVKAARVDSLRCLYSSSKLINGAYIQRYNHNLILFFMLFQFHRFSIFLQAKDYISLNSRFCPLSQGGQPEGLAGYFKSHFLSGKLKKQYNYNH